jgi:3-phenylpropionate/trans-cinnamate dioxygenase ferredoxin reductase component
MRTSRYVILGGGMVAGYAAKEMVEHGLKPGELTIVSADSSVPYERPPLSKGFLAGKDTEEGIRINPDQFYHEHGIEVRLGASVAGVDPSRRELRLETGEDLRFEQMIIATGARVRTLDLPGALYLRSLEDSKRIRERAAGAKRATVIGGGFIGMEVAAVLAQKGVATTMAIKEDRLGVRLFTPPMSQFFENYYTSHEVQFVRGAKSVDARGKDSDMVVAGIGVVPVTEPLTGSGIEVDNGVLVNEFLETSTQGIYAAGDVANYQDTLFGKRRRVEHWDNAVSQGQHLGRTLMGDRKAFVHVPYFFSDVFDLSYEYWGDAAGATEVVERGDLRGKSFSVWWLRDGAVVAAFVMNRPDEERETAPKWIEAKKRVPAEQLRNAESILEAV